MASIPRERRFDSTLALKRYPYGFISKRCLAHGSDVFQTMIMLRRTICMSGRRPRSYSMTSAGLSAKAPPRGGSRKRYSGARVCKRSTTRRIGIASGCSWS